MQTLPGAARDFTVNANDVLLFQNLTPADNIIEVGSSSLTSEQLCDC